MREKPEQIGAKKAEAAEAMADEFCPGDLIATRESWFELLLELLTHAIGGETRDAIWALLMSGGAVAAAAETTRRPAVLET